MKDAVKKEIKKIIDSIPDDRIKEVLEKHLDNITETTIDITEELTNKKDILEGYAGYLYMLSKSNYLKYLKNR